MDGCEAAGAAAEELGLPRRAGGRPVPPGGAEPRRARVRGRSVRPSARPAGGVEWMPASDGLAPPPRRPLELFCLRQPRAEEITPGNTKV